MYRFPKTFPLSLIAPLLGILLCVFLLIAVLYAYARPKQPPAASASATFDKPIVLADSGIIGKAAVIYDPSTGKILYAKNANVTLPLASLTKLMTAEVVLSTLPTSTLITISAQNMTLEGDAGDWNLKAGDTMTLDNIIRLGLDASSNHAMAAAADALGPNYLSDLNKAAVQLGLTHTYFLDATGLDINTDTSGAYGSAYDIARLAAVFMRSYPSYFEISTSQSVTVPVSGREVTVDATALPILSVPGLIGLKTGYTDLAGGNLVAAFDEDINHPLIAVVLGSTEDGRFTDMRTLINAVRASQ